MKKIVFIHLFNDRSGSPKVLSQTIKAFKKVAYKTELMTSIHKDGFLTNVADKQYTLFYKRSEKKLLTLLYYIMSQTLLFFQCLRYWNQDVVFYINTMMPFGAALAGKLMKKKVIYHVHETSIKPKVLKQFLRSIISFTATKVVFVSKYLQKEESFGNKNQTTVYNALENISNDNSNDRQSEIFNVLMICSLKKYKGVLEFITIAKKMQNIKDLHFTLILNASKDEINKYFDQIAIPLNITVFERQSDVNNFYKNANLLLNLSRPDECIETFGLTILEGMSYGLPVIVPPVGGPVEIVRDGKDGFQISCYDTAKIIDTINYLIDNKDEYKTLSNNSRESVKAFDIDVFEKEIVKVIEDI